MAFSRPPPVARFSTCVLCQQYTTERVHAVDWAVRGGVTSTDKVAIMGGSYGGYATLAGLAFTPDKFACGVDIVGPSNLETLLKTVPAYSESGKVQFYKRMGDPTTAEGLALLKARSPLYKADQITKPLLIGQGANDPRVNVKESEQIVVGNMIPFDKRPVLLDFRPLPRN